MNIKMDYQNEVLLITGGCGFIGSNFIRLLDKVNYKGLIVNVDKLTYAGKKLDVSNMNIKYNHIQSDIADHVAMTDIFETFNPNYVVNFAAESHVDRSINDASPFIKTNISGTQVLLDLCVRFKSNFLQISTDEVYGDIGLKGKPSTEKDHLKPSNPYAASKAAADLLTLSYVRTHGIKACITRCSNNYGPYQFPEKLIPVIISNMYSGKPVPIYGNGENIRDWIHVKDHCLGILQVLKHGKNGEIYNFGGNNELTNNDVVQSINKVDDITICDYKGLIKYIEDRKGHDVRYAINYSKAKKELQWEPMIKWEDGITNTVHFYVYPNRKYKEI